MIGQNVSGLVWFMQCVRRTLLNLNERSEMHTISRTEVTETVRNLLATGDDLDRCVACRTLGELGDVASVPALIARLNDEDIDVCLDAAAALAKLGDPEAVVPLLESLYKDPSSEVKTAVVEALGLLGGEKVIPHLIEMAVKRPENMLGDGSGGNDTNESWDPWWDIQRLAVTALGRLHADEAVPVLTAILEDKDNQDIESEVLTALACIGGSGEAVLIKLLMGGSARERRRAARAMGEAQTSSSLHALANALEDGDDDVRAAVIDALARRQASRYAGIILPYLKDPAPVVRHAALNAVAPLASGNGVNPDDLIGLADDDDPQVRAAALLLLNGELAGERASSLWDTVQRRLADTNAEVAGIACQIAAQLDEPHALKALLAVLDDASRDASVRSQAAVALGKRNESTQEVLDGLMRALGDKMQPVRLAALHALMALANSGAEEPLGLVIGALRGNMGTEVGSDASNATPEQAQPSLNEDTIEAEEISAADANRESGLDDDLESLLKKYEASTAGDEEIPDSDSVRGAGSTLEAVAMGNVEAAFHAGESTRAVDEETAFAQLPQEQQEELADYIGILDRQRETWKRLTKPRALDVRNDVRALSARVLGGAARPEVVTALIEAMQDAEQEIQIAAVESLARIARAAPETPGLQNAVGPLITHLNFAGRELRLACAHALGALGKTDGLAPLMELLKEAEPLVRSQAIRGLVELVKGTAATRAGKPAALKGNTVDEVVHALTGCLNDKDPGVQKATAQGLSALNGIIKQPDLLQEVVHGLIDAGIAIESNVARDMGRTLRAAAPEMGGGKLVEKLATLPNSIQRRFAMEMLEEIYRPDTH